MYHFCLTCKACWAHANSSIPVHPLLSGDVTPDDTQGRHGSDIQFHQEPRSRLRTASLKRVHLMTVSGRWRCCARKYSLSTWATITSNERSDFTFSSREFSSGVSAGPPERGQGGRLGSGSCPTITSLHMAAPERESP